MTSLRGGTLHDVVVCWSLSNVQETPEEKYYKTQNQSLMALFPSFLFPVNRILVRAWSRILDDDTGLQALHGTRDIKVMCYVCTLYVVTKCISVANRLFVNFYGLNAEAQEEEKAIANARRGCLEKIIPAYNLLVGLVKLVSNNAFISIKASSIRSANFSVQSCSLSATILNMQCSLWME